MRGAAAAGNLAFVHKSEDMQIQALAVALAGILSYLAGLLDGTVLAVACLSCLAAIGLKHRAKNNGSKLFGHEAGTEPARRPSRSRWWARSQIQRRLSQGCHRACRPERRLKTPNLLLHHGLAEGLLLARHAFGLRVPRSPTRGCSRRP